MRRDAGIPACPCPAWTEWMARHPASYRHVGVSARKGLRGALVGQCVTRRWPTRKIQTASRDSKFPLTVMTRENQLLPLDLDASSVNRLLVYKKWGSRITISLAGRYGSRGFGRFESRVTPTSATKNTRPGGKRHVPDESGDHRPPPQIRDVCAKSSRKIDHFAILIVCV